MKLLVLGNSNDTGGWVPEQDKRHVTMGRRLAEEFGDPVEVVAKNSWPNDRLPDYVARVVEEEQPDLVFMNVTAYAFSYESLPLRVRRRLGKIGEPLGDAGFRIAESKRWSHNAVFRTLRRWAQATIGGETHFTPEEVIERYTAAIRVLTQREGMAISVKGPFSRTSPGITKREKRRHEHKRQKVHRALKQLCEQLHVSYHGTDEPYWKIRPQPRGMRSADGLHANSAGAAYLAEDHYAILRLAWAEHLAKERGVPPREPRSAP